MVQLWIDIHRDELIADWELAAAEDTAYITEVPELPGCMADGKTYQEALANVEGLFRSG